MKTAIPISVAMALSAMVPASAQVAPPPPTVPLSGASPSVGPWIVGGIALGALSVIVRAKVVSDRENRELTSDEAAQAIFLPFFWMFSATSRYVQENSPASRPTYAPCAPPQRYCRNNSN